MSKNSIVKGRRQKIAKSAHKNGILAIILLNTF
jgi:hypothetical protein